MRERARKERTGRGKFPLRYVSIIVFAALTIGFGIMIPKVTVNYDLAGYLPEESISKQGYDLYSEEFGGMHIANLMVSTSQKEPAEYTEAFEKIRADSEGAVTSVTLRDQKSDTALYLITFSARGNDEKVAAAVDRLTEAGGDGAVICGTVVDDIATAEHMMSSALLASVILVPVIVALVLLTTKSFLSMLLVLLTLGVSIVINMGTNFMLPSVSFLTQGITLALQLAITLDYAIFMIHEYERLRGEGLEAGTAVRRAVKKSITSIFSACLTTVAGFVALMFMRFAIGQDLGLVFIKGILVSFAAVVLLLPALLLVFDRGIARTSHRPLIPKFEKSARGIYKTRYVFLFLVFLVIPAVIFQGKLDYIFGSTGTISGKGVPTYEAKLEIAEVYGRDNSVILLLDKEGDRGKQLALERDLSGKTFEDGRRMFGRVEGAATYLAFAQGQLTEQLKGMVGQFMPAIDMSDFTVPFSGTEEAFLAELEKSLTAKVGEQMAGVIVGQDMLKEGVHTAFSSVLANFDGETRTRIVLSADTAEEGAEAFAMYETVLASLESAGYAESDYLTLGETPSAYDMKGIMLEDNTRINLLSYLLVFLIIAVTFRSLSIPVILMVPILTGIYINIAIPAVMGQTIAFLGILVVSLIQLGATIDYAILYANKYCQNRKTMLKREASVKALSESIPSILTSAIALTVAGFSIGWTSILPATAQIGFLLGRAGLLSAFYTIFVLPGLMNLCDPILPKTSVRLGFLKPPKGNFRKWREKYEEEEDE